MPSRDGDPVYMAGKEASSRTLIRSAYASPFAVILFEPLHRLFQCCHRSAPVYLTIPRRLSLTLVKGGELETAGVPHSGHQFVITGRLAKLPIGPTSIELRTSVKSTSW